MEPQTVLYSLVAREEENGKKNRWVLYLYPNFHTWIRKRRIGLLYKLRSGLVARTFFSTRPCLVLKHNSLLFPLFSSLLFLTPPCHLNVNFYLIFLGRTQAMRSFGIVLVILMVFNMQNVLCPTRLLPGKYRDKKCFQSFVKKKTTMKKQKRNPLFAFVHKVRYEQ